MSSHGKYFVGHKKEEMSLHIERFTSIEQMFTKEVDQVRFGDSDYEYKTFDLSPLDLKYEGQAEEWYHMVIFLSKSNDTLFIGNGHVILECKKTLA